MEMKVKKEGQEPQEEETIKEMTKMHSLFIIHITCKKLYKKSSKQSSATTSNKTEFVLSMSFASSLMEKRS